MNRKTLETYLNDHLAAAEAGVDVCRHCLTHNRNTALGDYVAELVVQLDEDRRTLLQVMETSGVRKQNARQALATLAEKARRVTANGSWLGYSDLNRVLELESLRVGIEGKRCLWNTLQTLQGQGLETDGVDFDNLLERAANQQVALEPHRLAAAEKAFANFPATKPLTPREPPQAHP